MKRIYTCADPVQAGLVESLLRSAGIACVVRNQYLAGAVGELPLNECWPEVWVLDDGDSALAKRLIDDTLHAPVALRSDWTCGGCGETLEAQFAQCWRCGVRR